MAMCGQCLPPVKSQPLSYVQMADALKAAVDAGQRTEPPAGVSMAGFFDKLAADAGITLVPARNLR